MLPTLMVNMEGCSNNLNNNTSIGFSSISFDESVIINSVRNRKKNSELPNCPVCSCTIRQGELESHLCLEVERLTKISNGGNKRKFSQNSNLAMPGSSSSDTVEETIDVTGGTGSDVFQRVHANRLRRLCTRTRRVSPSPTVGQCPVCNTELPTGRLQRHALRCLKRTGAIVDEDVPDSSDEEFNIDVENDEPQSSGFGAEYEWCGLRIRASALQPDAVDATAIRRASHDTALVVDGDEDAELYGLPQYSPSRIEQVESNVAETENNNTNNVPDQISQFPNAVEVETKKCNGLVEASAETRIQALKAKIKELETKGTTESKCLICIGPYTSPAVSIQCWHVHCEVCWLDSLRAKKICPQCNAITTTQHLRRIYM